MLLELAQLLAREVRAFNVFNYITLRAVLACLTALVISFIVGPMMIRRLTAFAAEVVVFFNPDLAQDFAFRRKRGGHLFSKMRFISAQLDAYLADELWLANARHANAMMRRLKDGLANVPGVTFEGNASGNLTFARVPVAAVEGLKKAGFVFYDEGGGRIRLVTAFNTDPADVDRFVATVKQLAA